MILMPDDEHDERGIPSRLAFTGVGSSCTSLCASPLEQNGDCHVEKDVNNADSGNIKKDHSNAERPLSPLSYVSDDNLKSENVIVDDQHHEIDVDDKVVSNQNHDDNNVVHERRDGLEQSEAGGDIEKKQHDSQSTDNDVDGNVDTECHTRQGKDDLLANERSSDEQSEGGGDVAKKQDDSQSTDNDVYGDDVGLKCNTPQNKGDMVDDSICNDIAKEKLPTPTQQDEHDTDNDNYRDPSHFNPTNELAPTDSASHLYDSMLADTQRSSSPVQSLEPSHQGSTRRLQSSTSRRHGETSRRYSDSSRRTIRSERSSAGSSSASSSGSSSETDSCSSSSDSNSDSESYSSSSSSSYTSSESDSCSSDGEPSSSGSESDSSSDDEAESDARRYLISKEKYERTLRRDPSGPSSSFSFAPEGHSGLETDRKSRGKRSRKAAKSSYATSTQRRRYEEMDVAVHQDNCSTVCVIL